MEIEINYDEVAMKLLTLLSQNLLGEFHTEIESLPQVAYSNANINQIIAMEQYFIEGRYNKVMEMIQTLYKMHNHLCIQLRKYNHYHF